MYCGMSCPVGSKVENTDAGSKKRFLGSNIIFKKRIKKTWLQDQKEKVPHQNCVYTIEFCDVGDQKQIIGSGGRKDQEETGPGGAGEVRNYSCWSQKSHFLSRQNIQPLVSVIQNASVKQL